MAYVFSALFGAVFGISELVSRYRDEPLQAIKSFPSIIYICLNAGVSVAALAILTIFQWKFGMFADSSLSDLKLRTMQVLVSGFGAMALLRSSLFTVRVANQDVGIGLSAVVQSFLRAVDAAVDRRRGVSRDLAVQLMDEVAFDKAYAALPAYCFQLMQNMPVDEQTALSRQVESIVKTQTDPVIKSRMLGLAIMNQMGEKVLIAAVKSLGDRIK